MALVVIAALGLTAAACSGDVENSGKTDRPRAAASFTPNMKSWVLPLMAYTPDTDSWTYATQLVFADCMHSHGYAYTVFDPANFKPKNQNQYGLKLFDVDLARAYGYHGGPVKQDPSLLPPYNPVGAELDVDHACNASAQKALGFNQDLSVFAQDLMGAAQETAWHDKRVLAALQAWRTCMLPLGLEQ